MQQVSYYLKFSTHTDAFLDDLKPTERAALFELMRRMAPTLKREPCGKVIEAGEVLIPVKDLIALIGGSSQVCDQILGSLITKKRISFFGHIPVEGDTHVHLKILNFQHYIHLEVEPIQNYSATGG